MGKLGKKEIQYQSQDKSYTKKVNDKKTLRRGVLFKLLILPCLLTLIVSIVLLNNSFSINGHIANVGYNEVGNADYKVYLKQNNYYDSKYLNSGMQYVASLISSINTKFNYEIHSDKNVEYLYSYHVTGDLIIYDPNDESKILYTKKYHLLDNKTEKIKSNNLVVNEDIDIDYDEYNNYVNSYKRDYGISANSKLVVTMDIQVKGNDPKSENKMNHKNQLQISIPLSEQTINIDINSDKIDYRGSLFSSIGPTITNKILFPFGLLLFLLSLAGLGAAIWLFINYRKKNIYLITLHKFLRDYDRLIVNATDSISEKKFERVIPVSSFLELVDAAQNNRTSILFFEAIPGEKSFFLVIKDNTLYKYRLTKAYLEGNPGAEELQETKNSQKTKKA